MKRIPAVDRGLISGVKITVLVAVVALVVLVPLSVTAGVPGLATDRVGGSIQADAEFEPNDAFGTATEVAAPFEAEDLQTSTDDRDFYAIDLARGDHLDVSVAFDHDDGDVDLIAYDQHGNLVGNSLSITDDEAASIQANEAGTYYLLVVSSSNATASYSLAVDREAGDVPENDEFERNNWIDSATEITAPFAHDDLWIVTHDRDVYAVELTADSELAVKARFDHNETDIDLRLYDRNEELVDASANVTDEESLSTRIDESGVYYIEVSSEDDATGRYSLSVRSRSPTPTETSTPTDTPTPTEPPPPTTTTAADGPGFTGLLALLALGALAVWMRLRSG